MAPDLERIQDLLLRVFGVVSAVAIFDFIAFKIGAFILGGDALNGMTKDGRFYVWGVRAENGHKIYTEVSNEAFLYSKWHAYSVIAAWALMFALTAIVYLSNRRRGSGD